MFSTLTRFCPLKNFNEFFIALVYFVQGSGGITAIASSLLLKETFGLDFYQIGLIGAASVIPWSIKPLYGLLTDLLPIGGYRRKPYLHLGPILAVTGFAWIALFAHDFTSFLLPLVLANIGLGLTDVATDGFIVEQSDPGNAARLQGITQASIRVAAFVTSFFSGVIVFREWLTPQQVYWIQAALPLITFTASWWVREPRVTAELARSAHREFTPILIGSLLVIFVAIIGNLAFPEYLSTATGWPQWVISATLWSTFFAWIGIYFYKLKKLRLTTSNIFLAAGFILLWRFNPGAGTPFFFFLKDTLSINEETLGFVDTAAQVGSIIAVILAVRYFDRFSLKQVLGWTVLVAGLFGLSSFAITRTAIAESLGSSVLIDALATLIALPVYFCESLVSGTVGEFWVRAVALTPVENFLFVQGFLAEVLFMLAYIPLLKFAVLITPRQAEATNFAVISSIMNIGLALSSWASGFLYTSWLPSGVESSAVHLPTIELLIWVNILTSLACLLVLPWLRTEQVAPGR